MTAMADTSKQVRDRAEAQFKKTEQAAEGRAAAAGEHRPEALAVREKTARLRRLRLAKEAADTQAAAAEAAGSETGLPPTPASKRKGR
jgi:hypothetical protein